MKIGSVNLVEFKTFGSFSSLVGGNALRLIQHVIRGN